MDLVFCLLLAFKMKQNITVPWPSCYRDLRFYIFFVVAVFKCTVPVVMYGIQACNLREESRSAIF